jgi:hypothetical protein
MKRRSLQPASSRLLQAANESGARLIEIGDPGQSRPSALEGCGPTSNAPRAATERMSN